jgi:hypothetical protein
MSADLVKRLREAASERHGQGSGTPRWDPNSDEEKLLDEAADRVTALEKALEPFAWFGEKNTDSTGWAGLRCEGERINVWFGPSDFRNAFEASALSPKLGEEKR